MEKKSKIVVVSGSRSDWGLLAPLVDELRNHFLVRVIAIGSHLSEQFGHTIDLIPFDYSFYTLLDCDEPVGVSKSMALTILSLADKWGNRYDRPDCVLVLGDRFEIFAASLAAYNEGVKIAHIEGDDVTLGSLDEGYRKSIRSMASIHFDVEEYGSLGCVFPEIPETSGIIDAVVIFHSHKGEWQTEFKNLMAVMRGYSNVVYFSANADSGGRWINEQYKNMGIQLFSVDRPTYLGMLKKAGFIIGNSSSGFIESPSLGVPSINTGHRQDGRKRASSVIDCEGTVEGIKEAIEKTKQIDWGKVVNPYFRTGTVERIVRTLKKELDKI